MSNAPPNKRANPQPSDFDLSSSRASLEGLPPQGWLDALERTRDYIQRAMRPTSVAAACNEGLYERAHRAGLQHALNALNAEFAKAEAGAGLLPAREPPQTEKERKDLGLPVSHSAQSENEPPELERTEP